MKLKSKPENTLYLALWTLLFIVPVIVLYARANESNTDFQVKELLYVWKQFSWYLGIFLIHNFLLAPLLINRHKTWHYAASIVVLVGIFVAVEYMSRPALPHDRGPRVTAIDDKLPEPGEDWDGFGPPPLPEGVKGEPPMKPTPLVGQHDVVATIILLLMLGMNIGVKLYFQQDEDQKRMVDLERKNLEQQLEYLKYQINPHFLMNTLNNIHALIDIEPDQAKESIVELSKILRFVLYEGSKQKVPLNRELIFLENYVKLMTMRITDQVDLQLKMPEMIPDAEIPPLLLITFVENAFKHGISYQQPSFIKIAVNIENNTMKFTCKNSRIAHHTPGQGGVGLTNARRRLELIYGNDEMLHIKETEQTYEVELNIPL